MSREREGVIDDSGERGDIGVAAALLGRGCGVEGPTKESISDNDDSGGGDGD